MTRSHPFGGLCAALAVVALGVACSPEGAPGVADEPLFDAVADDAESLNGVTCAAGAALCSNPAGAPVGVYASLYRVGSSELARSEVAQTFTGVDGDPSSVRLRLRLLRDLPAGTPPLVTVAVREVTGGSVPTSGAASLWTGSVSADSLSRVRAADVDVALSAVGLPPAMSATATYALVLSAEAPVAGSVYVGVAAHKTTTYAQGQALRRAHRRALSSDPFSEGPFVTYGDDLDLSFSLTVLPHATCTDGLANGGETDVDCGGSCAPCGDAKACGTGTDCTSAVCTAGVCQVPTCTDGIENGSETDVDCGGGACPGCAGSRTCTVNGDCASSICSVGTCNGVVSVTVNGSSRNWSDGTFAASCNGYRNPAPPRVYTGATGDGVYTIEPAGGGGSFPVHCDMTTDDGGWTLVWKSPGNATRNNSAVNVAGLQSSTIDAFAKLADATINQLKSSSNTDVIGYRVEQEPSICSPRTVGYVSAQCSFNWVSGGITRGSGCDKARTSYGGAWYVDSYSSWCLSSNGWTSSIFCASANSGSSTVTLHLHPSYTGSCQHSYAQTRVWAR